MHKIIFTLATLVTAFSASAQYSGPRLFWDIPSIYLTTPDASSIGTRAGAGAETVFNVATFWGTSRIGGGATVTIDPSSDDIPNTFITTPYLLLEAGAGIYRSNGNQCNQTNQNAFTAMAVLGLRYDISTRALILAPEAERYGLHYVVGAELGYFFIRNMFRNTEVVVRGNYFPQLKILSANLGFKVFLNMREAGRGR
ncbi:MAG: hypothetical protein IPG32_15105 [Saprospirales bacterium]|jgi:hypothetical protein|nr:hypothetical protein [Saprospirales bacterium]